MNLSEGQYQYRLISCKIYLEGCQHSGHLANLQEGVAPVIGKGETFQQYLRRTKLCALEELKFQM
jgi:hypothetical protein